MVQNQRQSKVSKVILKDISAIIQESSTIVDIFRKTLVTITDVKVTPDFSFAYVYVSFLATSEESEVWIKKLQEITKYIKNQLAIRIRNQLRIVPNLLFFLDTTAEQATKMDNLFQKLHIPEEREIDFKEYPKLKND